MDQVAARSVGSILRNLRGATWSGRTKTWLKLLKLLNFALFTKPTFSRSCRIMYVLCPSFLNGECGTGDRMIMQQTLTLNKPEWSHS